MCVRVQIRYSITVLVTIKQQGITFNSTSFHFLQRLFVICTVSLSGGTFSLPKIFSSTNSLRLFCVSSRAVSSSAGPLSSLEALSSVRAFSSLVRVLSSVRDLSSVRSLSSEKGLSTIRTSPSTSFSSSFSRIFSHSSHASLLPTLS